MNVAKAAGDIGVGSLLKSASRWLNPGLQGPASTFSTIVAGAVRSHDAQIKLMLVAA
jgi:hypothetical protein